MGDWPGQTAISSIAASNTTYTSGQVQFTGSNAATVKSSANQRVVVDVPSQSVQTQSFVRAISASDATFDQTVRITGGPNVTVGSDASGASISGAAQTVQTQGLVRAISASDATKDQTVRITGGPNVTVGTDASGVSISGAAQTSETGSLVPGGNTTGTTASLPLYQNIQLSGGNNITISQSSGANSTRIGISGPNTSAQQTGISSISVSNTEYTSGRVVFTGSNAASVKSSGAGQTAIIDVPTQTAQTQSNIQGVAGSNTTYNTGTVEFTGSNMVTVKSSANQRLVIDATQSAAPVGSIAATGNTTGTMATLPLSSSVGLEGGNNITISQSSGASSTRFVISAPNAVAQSSETGQLIPGGNTTGTTASLPFNANISLAGGNNITVSQSSGANSSRLTISAANSSLSASLIPLGNTTGTTASIPVSANFALAGGNNITLSGHSDSSSRLTISAASQSVQTQSMGTGSVNVLSNTTGTTNSIPMSGAWALAGGPNITLSMHSDSTSRITISGPSPSGGGGISALSASDTAFTGLGVRLTGSNAVTVKSSGANTVVFDVPTEMNVVASDTTLSSGTYTLTGAGDITVNTAAGPKVQISGSQSVQTQAAPVALSQITGAPISQNLTQITSARIFPTQIEGNMTASRVVIPVSLTNAAASWTFGLYSLSNSSSATLWTSNTTSTPSGAGRSYLTMPFSCNITNGLQLVAIRQSNGSLYGWADNFVSFSGVNYTTGWLPGLWAAAPPTSIDITNTSLQRSHTDAPAQYAFSILGY